MAASGGWWANDRIMPSIIKRGHCMKKTCLQTGSLLVILLNLAGCNGGATSSGSPQNVAQNESLHLVKNSKQQALRVTTENDGIKWKDKIWDTPFMLQSIAGTGEDDSLYGFISSFPHGGRVYSEDMDSENSNKIDLQKNSFSPTLNSDEKILTVKPCYENFPGKEILTPAGIAALRVLLTSENRVFLASPVSDGNFEWKLLGRTHAQNDVTNIKLNDVACYVAPGEETNNTKRILVAAVGQKTDADNVNAYVEMGSTLSDENTTEVQNASWKVLKNFSEKGKPTGLNAVTIGNATDTTGSIEPVFAAAGNNGVIMRVDASTTGTARYQLNGDEPEANTNLNYNAIGYIPSTRRFLIGGDFYLTLVNMSGTIHVNDNIMVQKLLDSKSDYNIPDLPYSEKVGHVGVTSVACIFEDCAVAIKSFTHAYNGNKDNEVRATTVLFHITGSNNIPAPRHVKTYDSIQIDDDFFPGEFNPQLYGDLVGALPSSPQDAKIYLLTSTNNKSQIYRFDPNDASDFRIFITSMPNFGRSH